ncbi:MAG: hypothetical protein HY684_00010 [Chloroflexi bacterium]|nr:hypothetical protein [Chloroflexota bacterium]
MAVGVIIGAAFRRTSARSLRRACRRGRLCRATMYRNHVD